MGSFFSKFSFAFGSQIISFYAFLSGTQIPIDAPHKNIKPVIILVLKFNYGKLLSPGFERFMEILDAKLTEDSEFYKDNDRLSIVLSVGAEWVPFVYKKLPRLDALFSAYYLWSDETHSATEDPPTRRAQIDALYVSSASGTANGGGVLRSETISENAGLLRINYSIIIIQLVTNQVSVSYRSCFV